MRNGNLKKYISSLVLIMFMLSFMLVQAPTAQAKTLQTPIDDPANDVVVLNVEIGGQTLPYTWGDITGAAGFKFAGQAISDVYTENDEGGHETGYGIKLADLLADVEARLEITLADDYKLKAVCSDAYANSPFTIGEARDYAANHYLLAHKINEVSESSVGYKDTDPSVTYPATYCRIARNRGGDFSTDRFGNTAYMRLISSLQIIRSDNSPVELIDNGAGLAALTPDRIGLVIGGTGITNGAGLRQSFVYLSQDQVDLIKTNKSVAGLGLGDSWTASPTLYSSYHNHGTPEYVYRLAEGINLKTVLTALGADVTSAPVAIEATASDGYTATASDAFGHAASRNYIAPDGTVGPVVDPILIFYDHKVTTSAPDSSLTLPTTTEAIADANPLFAYGQAEATEATNCKFVKNTNKIRAGKVDPAFTITQDSTTKSISLSDIARIGIYQTEYSWNNSGTLVTQSVTGVPLSELLAHLGVAIPSNEDLIIKVDDGSGTVASSRSISFSELSRCFVAFDAFEDSGRSQRVSGSQTPLRIYCPGQTADRVLIENVVGASVDVVSQTYTVTFEENGGTAVDSITEVAGATINTAPVTTKSGCEFKGWYTDAGLTNKVVFPYPIVGDVQFYAKWTAESITGNREPGGDIDNSVFYIALKDASGELKYYYYTKAELEAYETQEAYTYDDHSVMKTVTCKGALLNDLLNDLKDAALANDWVVQYAEEDGYHADAAMDVADSNYKDTIESLTSSTVGGSGSTRNPMRPIVTYAIHEEYASPDAYNVNDPPGLFKDADNNSGYLRVYRDTGNANSTVMKYILGVVVSPDGALLTGRNGCLVTSVSDKNPTLKVRDDITIKGLLPGMQYAVKAPAVTNAALAAGQASSVRITVDSGAPADQVITFQYTEDTYFYVKNDISKRTANYTYTDLMAMSKQVPDADENTPPYGYSRPMYYRYNGAWLSDLVSGLSGEYTIKLVAKDGTKTDITKSIADYFVAYNNTQSKTSTNIPEGKRVTVAYSDAKIIIPGTGENITGSGATDYTSAGQDVDVLVAAAEGLEIASSSSSSSGGGGGGGGGSSGSSASASSSADTVIVDGRTVSDSIQKQTSTVNGQQTETFIVKSGPQTLVDSTIAAGQQTFEVNIGSSSAAASTVVTVPKDIVNAAQDLNLSISTQAAQIELPQTLMKALAAAGQELTLEVSRSSADTVIEAMADVNEAADADVLGTPTVIKTTLKGDVTVTLPLAGISIPSDASERETFLDSLRVFVIHSDGETKLVRADIVFDNKGNPVSLKFQTDKFSTFAIVQLNEAAQPVQPSLLQDIKGHWAEASIKNLADAGAITGYPDGSFKPDNTITRAEFAAILVKAYKLTATDGKIFADTGSHWAKEAIAAAAAKGIISGYSDTAFGPDDQITREQIAVMVVRAEKIADRTGELNFSDASSISAWARDAAANAVAAKLMSGYPDQTFKPQANATRAEAVSVIARALGQ